METKFTPGPWETMSADFSIDPFDDEDGQQVNSQVGVGRNGRVVAIVVHYGRWDDPILDADARLIAAAPEMFEALERIAELTPGRANASTAQDLFLTVRAIAQTALARARGEQP